MVARLLGLTMVASCALLVLAVLEPAPLGASPQLSAYTRGAEATATVAARPPDAPRPPVNGPEYDRRGLAVVRPPSIDVATIQRVLRQAGSPAVDEAQAFYDLGERYGLDPAICLAFFIVESGAGTKGMATETRSVGNIRATPGYINHKGYRKYSTWREGVEDWYRLIGRLYVGEWGLLTVETIVPVYAPSGDGNDPAAYITTVRRLVSDWRAGRA
jgi:hypothetical protein